MKERIYVSFIAIIAITAIIACSQGKSGFSQLSGKFGVSDTPAALRGCEIAGPVAFADQDEDCTISVLEAYDLLRDVRRSLFNEGSELKCDFSEPSNRISNTDINYVRNEVFPNVKDQVGMKVMAWALIHSPYGELTEETFNTGLDAIRSLFATTNDMRADVNNDGEIDNTDINEYRNRSSYVEGYKLLDQTNICE